MATVVATVLFFRKDKMNKTYAVVSDCDTKQQFMAYERKDVVDTLFDESLKGKAVELSCTIHPMPPTARNQDGGIKLIVHNLDLA